jgi:FAD/FMN-containing dehydrogenase
VTNFATLDLHNRQRQIISSRMPKPDGTGVVCVDVNGANGTLTSCAGIRYRRIQRQCHQAGHLLETGPHSQVKHDAFSAVSAVHKSHTPC